MEILDKIREMKETYGIEDQPTISAWEEQAKQLLLVEHIAGSQAVQKLIQDLNGEIEKMNYALLNASSTVLTDAQRDRLLDKRELYKRITSYFDVEGQRETLENNLK